MRFPAKITSRSGAGSCRGAFGLPYLLVELFYIGMPVVWTDGRSGIRSRDYQNFSDG